MSDEKERRYFTVKQSSIMAKTLRDIIHSFGLNKSQLAGLAKEFDVTETSIKGIEIGLIRALNGGNEPDWSKKRR